MRGLKTRKNPHLWRPGEEQLAGSSTNPIEKKERARGGTKRGKGKAPAKSLQEFKREEIVRFSD